MRKVPTSTHRVFDRLRGSTSRDGFSLVELIAVLAVIVILTTVAVPMITGTLRSYKLDTTGQTVVNQLNLARQVALSQGHAVQVRFYQLPDFTAATSATPTTYRGMQSFIESDPIAGTPITVTTTALNKPIFFPAPIVLLTSTSPNAVSPLVSGTPSGSPAVTVTVNAADTLHPLPPYATNYKYVVFHFKPDGSTDLTSTTNSVTLVSETDKIVTSGLPANFETIEIDPLNGAIRSFRP